MYFTEKPRASVKVTHNPGSGNISHSCLHLPNYNLGRNSRPNIGQTCFSFYQDKPNHTEMEQKFCMEVTAPAKRVFEQQPELKHNYLSYMVLKAYLKTSLKERNWLHNGCIYEMENRTS